MTGSRGPRAANIVKGTAAPPSGVDAPALPEGYDPRTVAWWEALRALPHAAAFLEADWQVALRGAWVLELAWARPSSALLTEVRRIEASLGMTKGDRDRLGVAGRVAPPPERPGGPRPDPRLTWREHEEELVRQREEILGRSA